jgi:replicative DNA helicase
VVHELVAPQAEAAVLGACLLDGSVVPGVLARLAADAFGSECNAAVYEAIRGLAGTGRAVDLVGLVEFLRANGGLDRVGGALYLSELLGSVATSAHVGDHVAIVEDRALLRRLAELGGQVVEDTRSGDSAVGVLDRAQRGLFRVWSERARSEFGVVRDVMPGVFTELESLAANPKACTGIPSGFGGLDRLTLGFQPADFVVLAARPSMGKTSLALNWARNAAAGGDPVAFFSLEMGRKRLVERLLASTANVDAWRMRAGRLNDHDWSSLAAASGRLADLPFWIDDSSSLSVSDLGAKASRLAVEAQIKVVFVDYLQLVSGRRGAENRNVQVAEISSALKALAKSLNVPVIVMCQLSRAVEHRGGDRKPILADLRDSGAIEQDADAVMFLWRPGQYEHESCGPAELIVAKHRDGPTGMVPLHFDGPTTTFTEPIGGELA